MWRRLKDPKLKVSLVLWLLFLNLVFFNSGGHGQGGEEDDDHVGMEEMQGKTRPTISERLRSVCALFGTASYPNFPVRSYWDQVKRVINEAQARFFPPNLDFRGGEQVMDDGEVGTGEKVGEKVKEAMARSVEKGKETLEDSAKSAAKLATEAVEKTKEKVKKTLSDHGDNQHHVRGEL